MSTLNPGPKRIALFLDGTWNTLEDNTNVWRLKSLCRPDSTQIVYYSKGVGTQAWEKFSGGVFGHGIDQELIDAYEWLIENYEEGDKLFLFGFSRGAYTARSLSGLISKCGLLRPGSPLSVRDVYDRYRQNNTVRTIRMLKTDQEKGGTETFSEEEDWMLKYCMALPIKFLGLWDTVGDIGVFKNSYQFLEADLRINNDNAYQALAIDEHRKKFAPTLWIKPKNSTAQPRSIEDVEQRWFAGAHANVGGGYRGDLLAQLPLKWLMSKAILHGLKFRNEAEIDGNLSAAPIKDSYAEFMWGIYKYLPFSKRYYRPINAYPVINAPDGAITINETIDSTVFDRWRKDKNYRPNNLKDWAQKHNIAIESLMNTVRADQPSEVVSDVAS